jgi:predicted Zn-dependent protease
LKVFRFLVVALVSLALNAPLARAQSPDLPSLGEAGAEELPPAIERRLGEQIMLQVRRDPTYLADPESTEYLNNLGYRLVSVSPSRSLDFVFFNATNTTFEAVGAGATVGNALVYIYSTSGGTTSDTGQDLVALARLLADLGGGLLIDGLAGLGEQLGDQ